VVELSTRAGSSELHDENLERLVRQGRSPGHFARTPEEAPVYELVVPSEDPRSSDTASNCCPRPIRVVFFDFEGHPFWSAQNDLFFLSGLRYRDDVGSGVTTRAGRTTWTPRPSW